MSKHPRILLAAPRSGSGKTLMTCALIRAFTRRGLTVSAFKTGPDYIDPMFHRQVLGVPSDNLDLFFTGEEGTRQIFDRQASEELSVIEGVMGLYDGMGGIREEGSAYHLACTLEAPVLLIVDARGMARSVLAEIAGFLSMDHAHRIKGILCNRLSGMLAPEIKRYIEETFHIPMVGYVPNDPGMKLESRYLGLKLPEEIEGIYQTLDHAADLLEQTVDLDQILSLAQSAPDLAPAEEDHSERTSIPESETPVRIAVARDDAFCFYYAENFRLLERMGAQIVEFSPLHDRTLPDNIQGLIMGGGYPEQYAKKLSENESMRSSIRGALEGGLPSLAECGGFMYLHETITDESGTSYPMVGAVPGDCHYTGKLVRFGYITVSEHTPCFMPEGGAIRAHEFHYYDSDDSGSDCLAKKPTGKRSWNCEHVTDHSFWGYPHLYYPSNPSFAEQFVRICTKSGKYCP